MPRNRYTLAGAIIAFLMLANFVYYFFSDWGLITVKVQNKPLSQVIKSIEWQGWVKIYTNIDPDTKVSMYVDKVPLPEALESLAVNITPPPNVGRGNPGEAGNGAPPAGAPGGNGFGGRGGGFGRGGAQWNMAFFVAATAADVKAEIRSFETGTPDDNLKTYNYRTTLGMLATGSDDDSDPPVADPRLQTWPGLKEVVIPVSTNPTTPTPLQAGNNQLGATPATPTPVGPPTSVQGFLQAFAQSADIFIMANSTWDPPVANPPAPSSSIVSAIKNFVSHSHGAYTQAYVVFQRVRGQRGAGDGGGRRDFAGDTGWSTMDDRMRNAANGLPDGAKASVLNQLDQEAKFRKDVQAAPPEQQPAMLIQHMQARMADNPDGGRMSRMSPEQRAQRMQRMVSVRMAAQGKQ